MAEETINNEVKWDSGIVKSVQAGNRITIREPFPKTNTPPLEKVLVLQHVVCPEPARFYIDKITKNEVSTEDAVGAVEAREFTRSQYLGKAVKFSIEYADFKNSPDLVSGNLWLEHENPDSDPGLIEKGLSAGWFTIDPKREYLVSENLKDLQRNAANYDRGLKDSSANLVRRNITWKLDNHETVSLVKRLGKKKLPAQIDLVVSGSTVKVYLKNEQTYVMMQLTGVRANPVTDDASKDSSYALEAKLYLESRLLHKDVEVILDYADPADGIAPGRITGTILHPRGNIAELLLSEGLAKCADWSIKYYTAGPVDALRSAQNKAKANKKRLWKNYKAPAEELGGLGDLSFNAVVKQILTTDTIIVRKTATKEDMKLTLASIRALNKSDFPESWQKKISAAEKEKAVQKIPFSPVLDMPVNFDAKEFIRKKLILQRVKVCIDYKQEAREGVLLPDGRTMNYPERICATVMFGDTNIAEAMAFRGYVKVITHSASDDKRSSRYDELTKAELKAQQQKKGIYDMKMQLPRIIEVTGKDRAGPFFNQYSREGHVKVVVDYVFSATRLKCYVPKDNINIMVIIAGLEAPKVGILNKGVREPSEPFALEGQAFTRDKIMQTEVSLQCVGQDKHGSFVAYVYDHQMNNISNLLAAEGLAKVHHTAERHFKQKDSLYAAEAKAKNARKNIWKNWVEEDDVEDVENYNPNAGAATANVTARPPYDALVSEIREIDVDSGDNNIYIAVQADANAENIINQVQSELNNEMTVNPPLTGAFRPKRNDVIAARWPADGQWYRARVDRIVDKAISVTFVDYGNSDTFNYLDHVGKLPVNLDLSSFKAQSKLIQLAFVAYPSNDYRENVIHALREEILNLPVQVQVRYEMRGGLEVASIFHNGEDLCLDLINSGNMMVASKAPRDFMADWKVYDNSQREAIRLHKNIWCYGDMRDEE